MTALNISESYTTPNPLDTLENLFSANELQFERNDNEEIIVMTTGGWCDYRMSFSWREDMHSLFFSSIFDMRIPLTGKHNVPELLMLINRKMWMGYFDLCPNRGTPVYRHTVPTRGLSSLSTEILEDLMDIALAECERFYPAFQFHLWGGHSPSEAVQACLLECHGQA